MQTSDVPREAFEDRDFLFILQLAVPCLGPIGRTIRDGHDGIFIVGESDPSWVEISADASGKDVVNYGGPRLLWPHIAESWQRFLTWQRPDRRRLGLTAYDDGRHHIWLDNDSSVLLTLPSMPIAE
jgi:hypothetical protein